MNAVNEQGLEWGYPLTAESIPTAAEVQDLTIPMPLASALLVARVVFSEVTVVRSIGFVREVFRHTMPGVLELVTPAGAVLRED
jgi:hypothetical protein